MSVDRRNRSLSIIGAFLFFIAVLVAIDVVGDFKADGFSKHIGLEILIGLLSMIAFCWLVFSRESAREALHETKGLLRDSEESLLNLKQEAEKWKKESSVFIRGLSQLIDTQFDEWKFSPAEKDVALLLIKGLSLKEIADTRQTSEKTVRAQSLAVYGKAAVKGRNELAAFFLEDLLAPSARL